VQQILDQFVELRGFLELKFDRVETRLDRVEARLDHVETRVRAAPAQEARLEAFDWFERAGAEAAIEGDERNQQM
jgi:hypothetical protein